MSTYYRPASIDYTRIANKLCTGLVQIQAIEIGINSDSVLRSVLTLKHLTKWVFNRLDRLCLSEAIEQYGQKLSVRK